MYQLFNIVVNSGRRGGGRMVIGCITTYAISACHHWRCEFEPRAWRGLLDTTLCDKFCQRLVTGRWFSSGTPISSTNKTDHHDITEILLKVALNTINQIISWNVVVCVSVNLMLKKKGGVLEEVKGAHN